MPAGCLKDGGSYVCLRSPDAGGDYSLIIETIDAKTPQTLSFRTAGGLAAGPLHVWRSNEKSQFERRADISPAGGVFVIVLEPGSVYSLTTTTGQQKGAVRDSAGRPSSRCPIATISRATGRPDAEVFFRPGRRVRGGRSARRRQCLRQVIVRRGIDWHFHATPAPYTMIGSGNWRDYEVSCVARVEKSGYAASFGRITSSPQSAEPPKGYWLKASTDGRWELNAFTRTLAAGNVPFAADRWHKLALRFKGPHITAQIDGTEVKTLEDHTFGGGLAGLGTGWNAAMFDDFEVHGVLDRVHSPALSHPAKKRGIGAREPENAPVPLLSANFKLSPLTGRPGRGGGTFDPIQPPISTGSARHDPGPRSQSTCCDGPLLRGRHGPCR